jgi:hypothetical protein
MLRNPLITTYLKMRSAVGIPSELISVGIPGGDALGSTFARAVWRRPASFRLGNQVSVRHVCASWGILVLTVKPITAPMPACHTAKSEYI